MTLFIGEREITPTIITKGGGSGDKYKVGDRVNDDSDNPVGTVSSIFTDGNGQRYAVVCLDAVNRLLSSTLSDATRTWNMYYDGNGAWSAPQTATTNTTAILSIGTSVACSHCLSKSFTIEGISYNGQLPNLNKLSQIFVQRTVINNQDPTASSYSSLVIPTSNLQSWSSTPSSPTNVWTIGPNGIGSSGRKQNYFVIPVLEIPLEN